MRRILILLCLLFLSLPVSAQRILVLGDSLSAAYGLPSEQGWVHLLQQRLQDQSWQVINASISGDTSAGGLARLPALLEQHQPRILILGLGANDGLRGLATSSLRDNLARIIEQSQAQGADVLLLGMQIPPNYGPRYTESFNAVYRELAKKEGVHLLPFLLEQVALDHKLMLTDNLHPNAEGQQRLLETVWPYLQTLLEQPVTK
jgi:acyl-CoA thioesterase-1